MLKMNHKIVLATAGILGFASMASATPLVDVTILGSTNGGNTFSNNLTVTPGESIQLEVLAALAPVGSTNSNGSTSITSIVSGTDGTNALAFNVVDSRNGSFNTASLALGTGWNGGSGFGVGTVSGNTLTDVRPIQAPGAAAGSTTPSVLLTGTFTAGNFSGFSTETLGGSWATTGTTSGSFKINGGSTKFITGTTESSADPYVGFSGLTLTTATPEPASAGLFGLAGFGLLMRRRRSK